MSGEFEAVGTIADGGMWARAAEPNAGESTADGHGKCLNCRTVLTGPHCHQCGQAAHVHRSISAFWHDILHGVLHFDGKFWNTLPLLAWQPGHLTRRYIHGERAKFISPMALFLFSIFMMFAIFSYVGSPNFTGDSTIRNKEGTRVIGVSDWREEMRKEIAQIEPKIAASSSELDKIPADDPGRAALTEKITDLKREVNGLTYATEGKARYPEALGPGGENMADMFNFNSDVDTGFKAFDAWIN